MYELIKRRLLQGGSKNEEEEFNTGPLSVLMMSVKNNTQVVFLFSLMVLVCQCSIHVRRCVIDLFPSKGTH